MTQAKEIATFFNFIKYSTNVCHVNQLWEQYDSSMGSTQPLKMSTRDFSWVKGSRCVWLTTYHPRSAERQENPGPLTYPEHLGPPRPLTG